MQLDLSVSHSQDQFEGAVAQDSLVGHVQFEGAIAQDSLVVPDQFEGAIAQVSLVVQDVFIFFYEDFIKLKLLV